MLMEVSLGVERNEREKLMEKGKGMEEGGKAG